MHGILERDLLAQVETALAESPATAILGPRQCGKTTLAREIVEKRPGAVYLDLERPSDLRQLADPELFFALRRNANGQPLVCLDEIQRAPEVFPVLRSILDESGRNGQLLMLGSASPDLLRQTSETLAGRLRYLELTPLTAREVGAREVEGLARLWVRGGFPRSYLAETEGASFRWRESFVQTFLERDLPQLGFRLPAAGLNRLWRMLAHGHGQLFNSSKLGASLGVSHHTVRHHLDVLAGTFMVRVLEPREDNLKKRLVKSPKVYLRDTGILHCLLGVEDEGDLLARPSRGESWEGLVIENVIAAASGWEPSFYRTTNGAEIDLVLSRGRRRIAVECKAATAPTVSVGFWQALEDLAIDEAWIVAPVKEAYPLREGVFVTPLFELMERMAAGNP